jgi:hypothetical protein
MKNILFAVLVFFAVNIAGFAQTPDEKAVAAAVEKLKTGMLNGDKAILNNIAAPELSYGHSSGKIEDKAAFVQAIVSGESDFTKIDLSDQTIKVVGNTALVRHVLAADTKNSGVAGTVKLAILLVWQKQQGQWKLLARQAVKV